MFSSYKRIIITTYNLFIFIFLTTNNLKADNKPQSPKDSLCYLLEHTSDKARKIDLLYELCQMLPRKSLDEAVFYFQDLIELSKDIEDTDKKINILLLGGNIYRQKGDYEKAYQYDLQCIEIKDQIEDINQKSNIFNSIGTDLFRLKKFKAALSYFNKVKDIYVELKDTLKLADSYNNIALIHDEAKEYEEALEYYMRAVKIFQQTKNREGEADVLNNIAGMYYENQKFEKTLEFVNKSLEIRREIGNKDPLAYTLLNVGALYFALQKYDKAIEYGKEGIEIAESIGILPYVRYGARNISGAYAKINDFENAYKYHIKYSSANDSIFNKEMAENINELQTKYETKEKEQQIALQNLKIERITIFGIASVAIILLISILIVILIHQNKQKNKINQILKDKNNELNTLIATKDKFFALISHDLKNPLSAFGTIAEQLDKHFKNIKPNEIHNYIKELSMSSKRINNLLANLLHWAAIQNYRITFKASTINIHSIVDDNISLLKHNSSIKNIAMINNIDENLTISSDAELINVVVRNLLSNAIKYNNKDGKVIVSALKNTKNTKITIEDTGIGMKNEDIKKLFRIDVNTKKIGNSTEKGTGLGLILVKEMLDKCNASIMVESQEDVGSKFIISLP